MLSKARIKYIKSLQIKKYRKQEQRFVVEGEKSVTELLQSDFEVDVLLATDAFLQRYAALCSHFAGELVAVRPQDLAMLGELKTNHFALAIARMKPNTPLEWSATSWLLALDDIRDPGNLGTIIRIADWYGLQGIVASPDTTDLYNHKVIQATMGSFTRIKVWYTALPEFLSTCHVPVLGAFLQGENIHQITAPRGGVLVIGNESGGISPPVAQCIAHRITIPRRGRAESLNAAVATAVLLDNLLR
jgi:TrmH family RNA methyltransferase